jgi:hypothetical protein
MRTDEDLLAEWKEVAGLISFYNAAEGQSWYDETTARTIAYRRFEVLDKEVGSRGLERPKGPWLL